jgi:hypothetical protein
MAVNPKEALVAIFAQYTAAAVHQPMDAAAEDLLWVEAARAALDDACTQLWRMSVMRDAEGTLAHEAARGVLVEALVRIGALALDGLVAHAERPEELYAALHPVPSVAQIVANLGRLFEADAGGA